MQEKYRLYRRYNRSQGTFYAQNCETGARVSLGTKSRSDALKLIRANWPPYPRRISAEPV